jgi:hypothetical protein
MLGDRNPGGYTFELQFWQCFTDIYRVLLDSVNLRMVFEVKDFFPLRLLSVRANAMLLNVRNLERLMAATYGLGLCQGR